jgi:hypothetical protein
MASIQPQKPKHTPLRRCIATGLQKPKRDLLRLVRVAALKPGERPVQVDQTGKLRGRGANITPTMAAFEQAITKGSIEHNLKLEQKLTATEVEALKAEFEQAINEREFRQGKKKVTLKISKEEFESKLGRQA